MSAGETLGVPDELAAARAAFPEVGFEVRHGTLVVRPSGARRVLSNAAWNGGVLEGVVGVVNHHLPASFHPPSGPPDGDIHAYARRVVRELGLAFNRTVVLMTGVPMENLAVEAAVHRDLRVAALVTAGVETNAMRAGDPATQVEENGVFLPIGTVNTILVIGAAMPVGAMTQAMVLAAEAKAAAFQELAVASRASAGIATGTGTDVAVVMCDPASPLHLSYAGGHGKLGELVAATSRRAIRRSLERRSGLRPADRRSALGELARFGLTPETLLERAAAAYPGLPREGLERALRDVAARPAVAAAVAAALHLADQVAWGTYRVPETGVALAALCEAIRASGPGEPGDSGTALEPAGGRREILDRLGLSLVEATASTIGSRGGGA
jgi:adenosylcobinamide amidohydrolase